MHHQLILVRKPEGWSVSFHIDNAVLLNNIIVDERNDEIRFLFETLMENSVANCIRTTYIGTASFSTKKQQKTVNFIRSIGSSDYDVIYGQCEVEIIID